MTREEAIEKLKVFAPMVVDDTREALSMAIEALQYLQEWGDILQGKSVKHGEWISKSRVDNNGCYTWSECSECGEKPLLNRWNRQETLSNFCPNCGAKMYKE